ncbi:O-methyltransferase [Aneurinibacillus uraniidurans]|uniref:O-methyltransferase n=1 Tax=Aneurinibacillus uraniidurans TaxID=2966586 RepID=UPI00234AD497|nr:O-methyltransferase [Aneurinibacillus sp. B1]WCN38623.1 O-methyltransferase [Aneurinibacillus sp. B1]
MITGDAVTHYIERLVPVRDELLSRMEQEAAAEHIPIIQLPAVQMLRFLLTMHQPKNILEVGMAIGYSTIWLARAADEARITSIEISEEMVQRATRNFAEAGVSDRITVLHQDAQEGLADEQEFDCIFLDAAKGQYRKYFDLYVPHLKKGGLLICDNVLFRGIVAEPDENVPKNKRGMITKLRSFNEFLAAHPALETTFVPIGDGLALCIKRGDLS